MTLTITPSGQACGAEVRGVDLSQPLSAQQVSAIREAWLQHLVLAFPEQQLSDDDLERFTLYFGPFGDDPFIAPVPGREHIIAVQRRADETTSIFAEQWHTDWSFQAQPPQGTCLYGITIPPEGGDTLFANQVSALAQMPAAMRAKLADKQAVHSAVLGYSPDGVFGEQDRDSGRSMDIRPSAEAAETHLHPLIRTHPETGQRAIYGTIGYIIGLDGVEGDEEMALLTELHDWQTREQFQYRHRWQPGTLLMWDNRSVLHRATGGYEGHDRLLHRTTIGAA
ncbi:TauD/TfdA family dioxygenase [Pseudohalioglobus sediminis]|uniref:TauD/TfdA family dioxygenase n=1 Tax=Pseudohalioglobus sediminis TaxID=2606449 RepID=A0A5B0X109_9GAMM|nr:TauD/TfdA family dioxygenase [Pseudohalioglobus sediminis]KAA1191789.1 TauD/TfdA family dioxygenase [Pseudohalioglobus sediminis]